jgi:hypothetical protein
VSVCVFVWLFVCDKVEKDEGTKAYIVVEDLFMKTPPINTLTYLSSKP